MKKYTVIIEIEVKENLIQDGLNLAKQKTQQSIESAIESKLFGYAMPGEYKIEVVKVIQPTFTLGELDDLGMI
jgi:hypothetical protein